MSLVTDFDVLSIQQRLYPDLTCFGCGPANSKGLQLRSYGHPGGPTATFRPWPEHDNGLGFLNGGIISTLLDCHSAAAVLLEADERDWTALSDVPLPYVTAGLDVRFVRPAPLHDPVNLHAHVRTATEGEMTAEITLTAGDKTCASAVTTWKRWRPRGHRG